MPVLDSSLSAMLHSLSFARSRSPAPSNKSTKSDAVSRSSRDLPSIEVRRPSEEERAFRGIKYSQPAASSTSLSSMASASSSLGRSSGKAAFTPPSPSPSHTGSMGFGRQSRRRMGNLGAPKALAIQPLRLSRSTSELSRVLPSPAPSALSRQSEDMISFLDFDSDGSDDEGQDILISASVSSATSSLGALTPPDTGSLLNDGDESTRSARSQDEDVDSMYVHEADHILDAISSRVSLDEPETDDHFIHPRSGKSPTDLPYAALSSTGSPSPSFNYSFNGVASPGLVIQTEYVSPSSAAAPSSASSYSPLSSAAFISTITPPIPASPGLDRALAEDEGGIIPLGFSLLPMPFDESRRPSEVSLASVSSAASDLTIDASTGQPRRRSSVYDSNFFENIISPALDKFPSPPSSASSTPASTPLKSRPLSPVEESEEPTTPTMSEGMPTIESLLAMAAGSPIRTPSIRRARTPPPPRSSNTPPPLPPLPASLLEDSPSRVMLSAEAPAPARRVPPAPLRFNTAVRYQARTRDGALRRAPSILSPTTSFISSSPSPFSNLTSPFDLAASDVSEFDPHVGGDFFEMDTPEFEVEMVMKVGGLEDINEEDSGSALNSPSFLLTPVSPATAELEERMWAEVTKGLSANMH